MAKNTRRRHKKRKILVSAVDLFCGAGGLTRGLIDAGIDVVAGLDIDPACKYPYEHNNGAKFIKKNVAGLTGKRLRRLYPKGHVRVLVGCAPCQPFSKYTQGQDAKADDKWALLASFGRLVKVSRPDVVSMENVPELQRHSIFAEFVELLEEKLEYHVSIFEVFCPDYGMAQNRSRLVLFASKFGQVEIIKPTHTAEDYPSVQSAIGALPPIRSGETAETDPLHRSSRLSPLNLRRIRASTPGGTWRDWPPSLIAACHRKKKGKTYPGVYGRMEWETPSPTITTQFFGFGNGRFGHPEQDRGLSLREGAVLQSFPAGYEFVEPDDEYCFKTIGRLIGNAVPVRLGKVVGQTIKRHLRKYL